MNRDKNLPLTETTYYVLLSLLQPAHGYLIMQKVEELSNHQVKIAAGTLYSAIENLLKRKLIKPVKSHDKRRKVYVTTEEGRKTLKSELDRMEYMLKITKL